MTVVALTWEDHKALMDALESRSPAVRQARVAHALLLMARGMPAPKVADLLFLPEAVVSQYWQAFILGQSAAREDEILDFASAEVGDGHAVVPRLPPPPVPDCSGRRRWAQNLHGSPAR